MNQSRIDLLNSMLSDVDIIKEEITLTHYDNELRKPALALALLTEKLLQALLRQQL